MHKDTKKQANYSKISGDTYLEPQFSHNTDTNM